jgi:hypothetical protein
MGWQPLPSCGSRQAPPRSNFAASNSNSRCANFNLVWLASSRILRASSQHSQIQLTDDDTITLKVTLDMMRPTLDAQHGPGFFATTPFQAIRAMFPRDDDFMAPRPKGIYLTDIELGALKAALDMNQWMNGATTHPPIYDKICVQ